MDIFQLILFGIITALLYLTLKDVDANIAFLIVLIASLFLFLHIINHLQMIITFIHSLSSRIHLQRYYLDTILKIIGIAYVIEIGVNITKDAGLHSVASKIELAGKIFILLLSIPIIQAVLEVVLTFIPTETF